jgi:hypothetical protein
VVSDSSIVKTTIRTFAVSEFVLRVAVFIGISTSVTGCVSLKFGPGPASKGDNYNMTAPSKPFRPIDHAGFDQAWKSDVTGNSIAIASECGATDDATLMFMSNESLGAVQDAKNIQYKTLSMEAREALQTDADGQVDGVPVKVQFLHLKKNGCNYTFVFTGRGSRFLEELNHFENFKNSFRVKK